MVIVHCSLYLVPEGNAPVSVLDVVILTLTVETRVTPPSEESVNVVELLIGTSTVVSYLKSVVLKTPVTTAVAEVIEPDEVLPSWKDVAIPECPWSSYPPSDLGVVSTGYTFMSPVTVSV